MRTKNLIKVLRLAQNESGIILPVVLWIILILSVVAFSLGRSNSVEIALTKHSVGKMKSYYLARAGVMYAMEQIYKDSKDAESNIFDSGRVCGFKLEEGKAPEDIFKNVILGAGHFDLSFLVKEEISRRVYGLQDQESKVNLNALNATNFRALSQLLVLEDVEAPQADEIAAAVVDWRDDDSNVTESLGAENDFYEGLTPSYKCKNAAFDQVEELLLVKGMTPEIFKKIKDYVTIFPKDATQLKINLDTASEKVMKAVGRSLMAQVPGTTAVDADQVAERLAQYRNGPDGKLYTDDDKVLKTQGMNPEQDYGIPHEGTQTSLLMNLIGTYHMPASRFITIASQGVDDVTNIRCEIEAVIDRTSLTVVAWRRK